MLCNFVNIHRTLKQGEIVWGLMNVYIVKLWDRLSCMQLKLATTEQENNDCKHTET